MADQTIGFVFLGLTSAAVAQGRTIVAEIHTGAAPGRVLAALGREFWMVVLVVGILAPAPDGEAPVRGAYPGQGEARRDAVLRVSYRVRVSCPAPALAPRRVCRWRGAAPLGAYLVLALGLNRDAGLPIALLILAAPLQGACRALAF